MKYLGLAEQEYDFDRVHEKIKTWSNRWTPDISKLEKYKSQLLFVYDEFMSDRKHHFVLEDHVFHKVVAFTPDKYDFLLKDGVALPFPSEDGKVIKGEILLVTPDAFKKLDKIKQNTVQFYRKQVSIVDPYRPYFVINNHGYDELGFELPKAVAGKKYWLGDEHRHTHNHVWMYFPNPSYWEYQRRRVPQRFHRIPSFTPKKEKTWLGEYYKYQNPEELG